MKTSQYNLRLQKIITAIAIVLFLVKMLAWYLTNSVAILTDALESTVNVVAGLIGVYSLFISAKPKDEDHPYGHGKVEFISAAVEGTLITVAGILVIYKAGVNLIHPHQIQKLDYGIILVAATAVVNFVAGTICLNTGRKNNSLALIASGKHLRTDTWSTLGIIIGLILLYVLKYIWLDSAVAIVFACIIIFTGYKIIRTSVAGIMDEADIELLKKLVELLNANRKENWIDLHNLRMIKYGGTLHIDCHLTVPWYLNVREAHAEVEALATLVRNEFGEAVELFVHSDDCREFSCRICYKKNCLVRLHDFENKVEWTINNIIKDSKHRIQTVPKIA
ncbi:MAG: cation diffusion facilitator family transporter [Bacteroidota bacterium]|nr:cation diffusion facilitator family transporter [Bacteroidota bacterium]